MGKIELYNIDLKNLTPGVYEYDYLLENSFFADVEGDLVQKGKVNVHLVLGKSAMMSDLSFHIEGDVVIPCDRCLDDMVQPIETDSHLVVKFGEEYAEENDEVIVIPEEDGKIDLSWFLYEFIVLAVPMKHVHAPGECNEEMSSKLKMYQAVEAEDLEGFSDDEEDEEDDSDDEKEINPRWNALKGLIGNNNN